MRKFISRKFNNKMKIENLEWFPVSRFDTNEKYDDRRFGRMGVKMGVKMGTEFKTFNQRMCKLHQISLTKGITDLVRAIISCSVYHSTKP